LGGLRHRLAEGAAPERGLPSLAPLGILALLDGLGVAMIWLVGRASHALWFGGTSIQDRFAGAFLFAIVLWRLYALLLRIVLRPTLAVARLCDMQDRPARRMFASLPPSSFSRSRGVSFTTSRSPSVRRRCDRGGAGRHRTGAA